ncbi:hypothetical protein QJQ45_015936 [Haematococcus lacustris]|nr:hypothetical protein QJQ45_015936 [Haematococcus lacustris]
MIALVCPGDRIGSADVYRAGSGTYERHGGIFAACCGQARDATSSSGVRERLLQVTAPQDIKSAIPKPGAVVTVKVTRVQQTSASCKVLVVGSTAVSKEFSGIIRLQDVRSTEIDKVPHLHHCFRPGDIVRAEVLSLGDARSYYLTTAKVGGLLHITHTTAPGLPGVKQQRLRLEPVAVAVEVPIPRINNELGVVYAKSSAGSMLSVFLLFSTGFLAELPVPPMSGLVQCAGAGTQHWPPFILHTSCFTAGHRMGRTMLLLRKLIHMLFAALRQPALIAASLRRRHVARATPLTPYGNPLPEVVHQVVNTLKPGRLVIVGDVHGCHSELMSLLRKLEFDEAMDNLAFVGDLVNKGPASRQVLASFRTMQALGVRGNHDDNCLQRWRVWHEQGSPLKPGSEWLSELDPEDVAVLEKLPFTLYLPTYGVLLCHAGLVPSMLHHTTVPEPEAAPSQPQRQLVSDLLSRQALANLVTMRNVVPRPKEDPRPSDDGKVREATTSAAGEWIGSPSASEGVAWAPTWPGPLHVFFGHDAKRRLQLEKFCTGLDTGCVYGGQLTAAVIPPLTQMTMQSEVARWWAAAATSAATGPPPSVTREALLCELVNVPADKMWCAPVTKTYKEAA